MRTIKNAAQFLAIINENPQSKIKLRGMLRGVSGDQKIMARTGSGASRDDLASVIIENIAVYNLGWRISNQVARDVNWISLTQ